MNSSLILSLIFAVALVNGDSNEHLNYLEETIGPKIVELARAAKYEAEIIGLVIPLETTCKNVVFDMNDWVNGNSFKKVVNDFVNINGKPTHVSPYNMKQARDAVLEENRKDMKNAFDQIMHSINEWSEKTVAHTVADVGLPIPDHVPTSVKVSTSGQKKTGDFRSLTFQAIEVKSFENDLKSLSNSLVEAFRVILNSLKDESFSATLFNHVGGDKEFRQLAYKVLDGEYNGSFVEEFGDRLAKMQKVAVLGRRKSAIITKVCMTKGRATDAQALVKIIPHGRIVGQEYIYHKLPEMYAASATFKSLDDLLTVKPLFHQQRRAIAADFEYQSTICRLTNRELCQEARVNLALHNGTFLRQLEESTLVITKETTAKCINDAGHPIRRKVIKSPIFLHQHKNCLLKVGGTKIGNQTVDVKWLPDGFLAFLPNDGGENSEWIPNATLHFGVTIGIGGIVVLLAVGFIILAIVYCRTLKKTATKERPSKADDAGV